MKNNKKLVVLAGAAALGLVAATGVTSGFAWFATNNSVAATGMEVTAKSNAVFLEIKGAADSEFSATGTSNVDADLYPVHHETWDDVADIEDFDLVTASTYDNWYYQFSDDASDADSNLSAKTYISSFTNYVATTTYQVKLHTGSQDNAYDLHVSSITIPANKGITVVVAGTNGYKEFSATNSNISYAAGDVLLNTVTGTASDIKVYIYFNGDDDNVYSNNITALTGQVSFTLTAYSTDHA